jgi:hypothetical protein
MKLGIVEHYKCGERRGRTLVWIPNEMSREEFVGGVRRAQAAYLAFVQAFRDEVAPNDYGGYGRPDYSKHPEKTVAEVEVEWEGKKKEWEAWNAQRQKAYRAFGEYLQEEGMKPVWDVEEGYPYHLEVNWGHRHGWGLEMSKTEDEDLAGPLKRGELFDD